MKANRLLAGDLAAPALLQRIVEAAGELAGAHYAVLGVVAPDGTSFNFVHTGAGEGPVGRIGLDLAAGDDLVGTRVEDARPFRPCLEIGHAEEGPCGLPEGHPPVSTLLSVPIEVAGEVLGNLYISRTSRQRFSVEEEELAAALAAIAGVAIKNSQLRRAALTRAEWMRASAMVTHEALYPGPHPLRLIVEQVAQVADADHVALWFPTVDGLELVVGIAVGVSAAEFTGARVPVEGTLTGTVYRSGAPRVAHARELTGVGAGLAAQLGIDEVMALPLRGSRGMRGVLAIARLHGRPRFGEEDLEMASAFAIQAAVSMELAEARAAERGPAPAGADQAIADPDLRDVTGHIAEVIGDVDKVVAGLRRGSGEVPAPRRPQPWAELGLEGAPGPGQWGSPVGERGGTAVFDALPVMIGYWDADLRNRMANRAYAEWFGLTPEAMHGRHLREVLGEDVFELTTPFIAAALRGEAQQFARTLIGSRGAGLAAEASYLPDRADGAVLGFLDVVTDPAARSNSEHALAEAHAQLTARAAGLTRANVDLEQFAVIAAHDLRSPLVGIAGLADALPIVAPEFEGDDEVVEMVEQISGAAHRGLDLVADLLDRARLGAEPATTEPVDLGELVPVVALELTAGISPGDVDVGRLPVVAGDHAQLRQLFTNLIGNSLKYVPQGQVPHVTITAHAADTPGQVEIRVSDNGIGIPAQDRSRVFAMFDRGASRAAADSPGTGVGLAICQRVVERHGGRIWVEESPAVQGTCIAFTLPLVTRPRPRGNHRRTEAP